MRLIPRYMLSIVLAPLAVPPFSSAQEAKQPPELMKVTVDDGVELHYVEKGKGVPVIFVHGAGMGYSTWDNHLGPFAESYRAIA
jgi:non-heme chloroperoxidase